MTHIHTWLVRELTADHVSLALAILALAVAIWAGYQAKRSASATEEQAKAASEQAKIADDQYHQSILASNSAEKAAKKSIAVDWHDINDRLMERAARAVVGVEELQWPPIVRKDDPNPFSEAPYPRTAEPDQPKVLNSRSDCYSQIYYWARGVIINDDTRSIQLITLGVTLIQGTTSLIDGEIKVPPKMHPVEGRYLLAPGKAALFEWRAGLTLERWIDVSNESEEARLPSAGIVVYPAGDPETSSYIGIEIDDCPVGPDGINGEVWNIPDYLRVCSKVKSPKLIPSKAQRQLLATLDESGSVRNDPRNWDWNVFERDFLGML